MAGLSAAFFYDPERPFGPLSKNGALQGARKGPSGPLVEIVCRGAQGLKHPSLPHTTSQPAPDTHRQFFSK